jgi:photosystem II stability/assembly factor-like uncharacterized protein
MGQEVRLLVGSIEGLLAVPSGDGGRTWRTPETLIPNVEVLAIRAGADGAVYVGTRSQGLFRSHNGMSRWEQVDTPPEAQKITSLCASDDRLLVGTEAGSGPAGVYEWSGAGGWKRCGDLMDCPGASQWFYPVPTVGVHVRSVSVDPVKPGRLYAAIQVGGVGIHPEHGDPWYDKRNLDLDVHIVEPHPTEPGLIYAGSGGGGMYRSRDFGETWEHISEECGEFVIEFALDPSKPSRIYLGTARGRVMTWGGPDGARGEMFRSDDGGASWQKLVTGLPDQMESRINAVLVDREDPKLVYVAAGLPTEANLGKLAQDAGVYQSLDAGESWRRLLALPDPVAVWAARV